MNYLSTAVNWEEFFIQEALELEEKMKNFDHESLAKPKLLIALENNILEWTSYEKWFCKQTGCSSFKVNIAEATLFPLIKPAAESVERYASYGIWDQNLIPLMTWNDQVYVLGLSYRPQLMAVKNHVFILTPPHVLEFLSKKVFVANTNDENPSSFNTGLSILEGIDLSLHAPLIDFSENAVADPNRRSIWEFISERHDEYSFEAKKHFSAYMVLRIHGGRTKVFKMDSDLEQNGINPGIFEYNLSDENPFQKVYQTGLSESFSLSQLGINVNNSKYACVTALKRGDCVVGFLVGFKASNLSENDTLLLEDLAKESA